MTTLVRSQIPPGITTVEQLVAWGCITLRKVASGKQIVEVEGALPENVVQIAQPESPNDGIRMVVRVNLSLDPLFDADQTKKLWLHARELTTGDIPVVCTTD